VGVADVLHLTYSTMSQLARMGEKSAQQQLQQQNGGLGGANGVTNNDVFSAFWDATAEDDRVSLSNGGNNFDLQSEDGMGEPDDDDRVSVSQLSGVKTSTIRTIIEMQP